MDSRNSGGSVRMILKRFRFIYERPHLWERPFDMVVEMKKAELYSRASRNMDATYPIKEMIEFARNWK